ncbi:MAG: hypothetical protein J7K39_12140, partial [Bacteroidales bacterium]|nr:hypothetical protein [Bacteroidales bacterium]
LKYTMPSIVVFLTAYFILKQVFDKQALELKSELKAQLQKENSKMLTPVRMQAYERMVLFLERISPAHLILRQNQPGLSSFQFQTRLIQAIREEFEHNLSQQLYISNTSWEQVVNAKEEMVRVINTSASKLKSDEPSAKLGELIINTEKNLKKPIVKKAIATLKKELEQNLG